MYTSSPERVISTVVKFLIFFIFLIYIEFDLHCSGMLFLDIISFLEFVNKNWKLFETIC